MKKGFQILTALVCALMLMGVTFVITYTAVSRHYGASEEAQQISQKTAELYAYLDHYFIGETDAAALSDAASSAMVDAIGDEWSYYIPADEYQQHLDMLQNAYVGIGITITQDEDSGAFPIVTVTDGGPAASAGLQAGDVITAINGQDVTALSMSELRSLVRGEEGTTLTLTYRRGDTESTCTLTRGNIETEVVHAQLLDGGIGYVRIVNFDGGCAEKTIAAIEDLQAQGAASILFDVRNNPGGLKSELVDLLDYLLPEGEIFHTVDYAGNDEIDTSDEAHLALPMAVLVNRESYSAAEFFAAALQEYEAAVIVGTQTYGKGYFQSALQLSDGSAINLSIGKYFTPQGKSLAGVGITPDLEISLSDDEAACLAAGTLALSDDPQLLGAISALDPEKT